MHTQARRDDAERHIIAGVHARREEPASPYPAQVEVLRGLLEPPEVREHLVASLKSAIDSNRYHIPGELVAQSMMECLVPCLRN